MTTLFDEQFYTDDFDQEILDFITSKGWGLKSEYSNKPNLSDNYLVYGKGTNRFWTSHFNDGFLKLTKEEFKEKIGMTTVQKKLKPSDVKNYVRGKHQPYTDYNKEIEDWLENNSDNTEFYRGDIGKFIFTGNNTFYRHYIATKYEVYYTNEEFKKLIGMDTTPEKSDAFPTLEAGKHIVQIEGRKWGYYLTDDIIAWVTYGDDAVLGWDRFTNVKDEITHVYEVKTETFPHIKYATCIWDSTKSKKVNIRKELEFAEAKKQRLENHINILKSKLNQ